MILLIARIIDMLSKSIKYNACSIHLVSGSPEISTWKLKSLVIGNLPSAVHSYLLAEILEEYAK